MSRSTGESERVDERLDRNWTEMLQELRVLQTGTQILAGFLLTLPFQARFDQVDDYGRVLFLVCISLAMVTTVVLLAPVSVHRALFRQHRKDVLVRSGHVMTRIGLVTLGLSVVTALMLIFTVVLGRTGGYVAGGAIALLFAGLWLVLPAALRRQEPDQANRDGSPPPTRTTSG